MKIRTNIFIILFLCILVLSGCTYQNNNSEIGTKEGVENFNFILKYGYQGKNILNTYDGTFTKDLVSAGTITTKLELTEEEKKSILDEMIKIDVFNYSNDFKEYMSITPYSEYILEVNLNGKKKTLNWNGKNFPIKSIDPGEKDAEMVVKYIETNETKPIIDLIRLEQRIEKIIENKFEYKMLPEPQGCYL